MNRQNVKSTSILNSQVSKANSKKASKNMKTPKGFIHGDIGTHTSLDSTFDEDVSTKDNRSCSSFEVLTDNFDNLSTQSSDNIEERETILNSTLKQKKKMNTDEKKYKTEPCRKFSETGRCPYGQKCKFAHGKHEIMKKQLPEKISYKSKKCNSFCNKSVCMYGVRCLFGHEERSVHEITQKNYYYKYVSCPELLEDCSNKKSIRLPIFQQSTENPKIVPEATILNCKNEREEFNFLLSSFQTQKYFIFGLNN